MFFGLMREKTQLSRPVEIEEAVAVAVESEGGAGDMGGCAAGYVPEAMRAEALEQKFQFDVDPLAPWPMP